MIVREHLSLNQRLLKQSKFVLAAKTLGLTDSGIIRRHILPNCLGGIAVYAVLSISQVILYESFLSFLGIGIQ